MFLDGTTDIRETIVSNLPPDDRKRQEKRQTVEDTNTRTAAIKEHRNQKAETLEKQRQENAHATAIFSSQAGKALDLDLD